MKVRAEFQTNKPIPNKLQLYLQAFETSVLGSVLLSFHKQTPWGHHTSELFVHNLISKYLDS
jgi:hypothetical protein